MAGGSTALLALGAVAPDASFAHMATVFSLSCVVGYNSVWNVTPALHAPLVSVTNAVSGITAVGGLVLMGGGGVPTNTSQGLAAAAAFVSAVNVGGGFRMTQRMLNMFKRPTDPKEHGYMYALPAVAIPTAYISAMAAGYSSPALHDMAGLAASALCIASIAGLSSQTTARVGNVAGMMGVGTGVLSTLLSSNALATGDWASMGQMGTALIAGGAVGGVISNRVGLTELPQLVAAFHTLVGAAAVMTAGSSYLAHAPHLATDPAVIMKLSSDWTAGVIGVSRQRSGMRRPPTD